MSARRALLGWALCVTLTGCPWPWGGSHEAGPTATPTPPTALLTSPAPALTASRQVFSSGNANVRGRLDLHVIGRDGAAVVGAMVWLEGPTPAWGVSDEAGSVVLMPLAAGHYVIRVSAAGLAAGSGSMDILAPPASDQPSAPIAQTLTMGPAAGQVTGHVVGNGRAIEGARISTDEVATTTGSDGSFCLQGVARGQVSLTVSKPFFAPRAVSVSLTEQGADLGEVTLDAGAAIVSLENGDDPFSDVGAHRETIREALIPLKDALVGAGFTWQDGGAGATIRLVACPGAVDDATAQRYRNFVAQGGKLILMGEWGGSTYYNPEALNRIASQFGLAFNADLVRSSQNTEHPGWLPLTVTQPPFPRSESLLMGIQLFEACSVFTPPTGWGLAGTGGDGYRIAADTPPAISLASARPYGAGLVVAIGDTSAWTSGSITGLVTLGSNLDEAKNRLFMLGLFQW